MPTRTGTVAAAMLAAALVIPAAAAAAGSPPEQTGGARVTLEGTQPSWAASPNQIRAADPHTVREVQLVLPLRDPAGAVALARRVSDPHSNDRGQFLDPREFNQRFAATDQTVERAAGWARSVGLQVTGVTPNRNMINVVAPVAALDHAFQTELAVFRTRLGGQVRDLTAPRAPVSLPHALAGTVSAVLGLDDGAQLLRPHHTAPVSRAAAAVQHCARWWDETNNTTVPQRYPAGSQSNSLCGYTAPQARAMYGLTPANTGAGTTIGIVGAYDSPTLISDIDRGSTQLGVAPLAPNQYSRVTPAGGYVDQQQCGEQGWNGEQTLDVQASHTTAPAAALRYYAGRSCIGGLYQAFNAAVAEDRVDIISDSWGDPDGERALPPDTRTTMNQMALQAAIQGQSVLFSTGDAGTNAGALGRATASFPATSPWVTAVGGTSVGIGQHNEPRVLAGWEDSGNDLAGGQWVAQRDADGAFAGGAGGGPSSLYGVPNYQRGVVPASAAAGHRAVPDIAALADSYTGFLVGWSQGGNFQLLSFGGTSVAVPLIAGMVADAQQNRPNRHRAGFLNNALYGLRNNRSVITDVSAPRAGVWTPQMHALAGVSVPSSPGTYLVDFDTGPQRLRSTPGWDPVTGIGTPAAGFVAALAH